MASGDRFYELALQHRSALWGDIGNLLKIEGLVIGGEGARAILTLPGCDLSLDSYEDVDLLPEIHNLSVEEWSEWLRLSDDPLVLVMPEKAFHRKIRWEISGAVQQKVWMADGLKCQYCGRKMGEVQLTIDHFVPLEMGGRNDASNYISACRKCNKDKGAMGPYAWCQLRNLDHAALVRYLAERKVA